MKHPPHQSGKKAVIYCRVSDPKQIEGQSLAAQEKVCREYALQQGYEVAKVFIEEGESAKTRSRPELTQLLTYCAIRRHGISAVIVYKLDRLSRNTDDYSQLRIILKRYGVEIKSTTEYFENTPAGRFMENIIANVAQFDNDVRAERCIMGMREACRDGRYVWPAPFGYINVKTAGKTNLAPDPILGPVLRETFTEIAKNCQSLDQTYRNFIARKEYQKGNRKIGRSQFYQLFTNEIYAGWIVKFNERNKGLFEPITTQEIFDQVQRVIRHRKRKTFHYQRENPDFPLRRFYIHPSGQKMTGSWSKGRNKSYAYYRYKIKGMMYSKEKLESNFETLMNRYRMTAAQFEKFKKCVRKHLIEKTADQRQQVHAMEQQVSQLKQERRKLLKKNIDGVINDDILQEHLELIGQEIIELESKRISVPTLEANFEQLLDMCEEYLKNPGKIWRNAPYESQINLQWFNFPGGIIYEGRTAQIPKICSIYKDNFGVRSKMSATVRPGKKRSHRKTGLKPEDMRDWIGIGGDLIHLGKLLTAIEKERHNY